MVDQLIIKDGQVVFQNVKGEEVAMPNLTKLVDMYNATSCEEIKGRLVEILESDLGKLLVAEIMVDMTNETTLKRIETGEISKTMGHVGNYYVVLDSHMDQAKAQYEASEKEGSFESIYFAQFPFGMVIEKAKFPEYANENYVNEIKNIILR